MRHFTASRAVGRPLLEKCRQLWLNLQNDYDIQIARRDLGKILDRIETVNKPEAA
jgi:plasmid maintenance system antidote protein VapI